MNSENFDCIVLGGGPGGYVAAIRASQNGMKTALVELDSVGGTCLHKGCIPSKALIAGADIVRKTRHAKEFGINIDNISIDYSIMKKRKDAVVEKMRRGLEGLIAVNKITKIKGRAKLKSATEVSVIGEQSVLINASSIIIATGSESKELPFVKSDSNLILDSTDLLNLTELPQSMVIIGGGVIGCEFASLMAGLGVKITIVEALPTILATETKDVSMAISAEFKKQGINIIVGSALKAINKHQDNVEVLLNDGTVLIADKVLIAIGRKPNSSNIGCEEVGIALNPQGFIKVNDKMETNIAGVYAIGDVVGKWLLAHVASHQGVIAADNIANKNVEMNYNCIPSVIFTYPEAASVGFSEEYAISQNIEVKTYKMSLAVLGKAHAVGEPEGFVKMVVEKTTGRILGASIVGYQASALIGEMAIAIKNELIAESIYETVHAHPTMGEAWMELALLSEGRAIHMPPGR